MRKLVSFHFGALGIEKFFELQLTNASGLRWPCQGARGGSRLSTVSPLTVARPFPFFLRIHQKSTPNFNKESKRFETFQPLMESKMNNSSKTNVRNRGARRRLYEAFPDLDTRVRFLVDANPKRPGSKSWYRFEEYFKAQPLTVRNMLNAGAILEDVRWDLGHQFIALDPVPT